MPQLGVGGWIPNPKKEREDSRSTAPPMLELNWVNSLGSISGSMPYPGGPSVANAAKTGDPKAYRLPVPHVEGRYNVSFSGLKTAVLNEVNQAQMKGTDINVPDLAASFQERIAGILAEKLLLAAADTGAKQVCLAGGVAANGRLRQLVNDGAQKLGARVYLPELKFCGDNGAMIAAQGYYQYIAGHTAGLELNGLPTLPIDYE